MPLVANLLYNPLMSMLHGGLWVLWCSVLVH